MSPPYCPETNIQESGTRFSYISFWAEFRVQKLIYENRAPDYCILVSGRSFLPPFYSSSGKLRGGCLGGFGEAFRRLLRTPSGSFISMYLHREASLKPPFAHPFRELHQYVFTSRSLQEASISGSFISMYLHRSRPAPGFARLARRARFRVTGSWVPRYSPSRAPVSIHREFGIAQPPSNRPPQRPLCVL